MIMLKHLIKSNIVTNFNHVRNLISVFYLGRSLNDHQTIKGLIIDIDLLGMLSVRS